LYSRELCEVLGGIFSTRTFDEWTELFDREDVWWAPVQHAHDLLDDPQAEAGGGFVDVPAPDGTTVRGVASPVDFGGTPWEPRSASPEYAQHTEEVCLELGLDWDHIIELKNAGVIP
ncbi:MAG: CoA transferase, partial [Actinomycetota bacterium]